MAEQAATIRMFLVCNVRLYADAITALLQSQPDILLQACCAADETILHAYDIAAPDVVLLDTGAPGALAAAAGLIRVRPLARLLGFGVHDHAAHVIACAQAGLAGYVPNTASLQDLLAAARRIAGGDTVCSAAMAGSLFRQLRGTATPPPACAALTERQAQIGRLLADGLSNKEIARRLSLGTSTVKNHVHEILDRLNVTSRNQVGASLDR
jgi:DNA-binding NarL/FixJ family response regulator